MYTPSYRVKNNGVPILSKKEINAIGENFVRDFQPDILKNPAPIDIEYFIEFYLGMKTDYQCLSHNGIYLGMTVFNDTNRVIIYSPATKRAEYHQAKARTVIIDPLLLEENQQHRLRFTLGHEGAHDILHSTYFSYDPNQQSMFDDELFAPMIQCRVDNTCPRTERGLWDDHDWMEWQANALSSAILMPESAVRLLADAHDKRAGRRHNTAIERSLLVQKMVNAFDVSSEAALYRLRDLCIIPPDDQNNYVLGSAFSDFVTLVAT